ncbi:MAG TPA: alpha/beta hydrolase-fold protein, partial [Thermoanaerobaculia bacterium]|nr:alpha/beta hydrolase-fold protein [Thermoanaerobaculia bacterium]
VCLPLAAQTDRNQFIADYGLLPAPVHTGGPDFQNLEGGRFDERNFSGYRYSRTLAGMRDAFRRRAASQESSVDVRAAIDRAYGVPSFLGAFSVVLREHITASAAGTVDSIDFRFGTDGYGQALVGVPSHPNGRLLIAIHGCLINPDAVLTQMTSYGNSFGLRALEQGYTVIAPYVVSQCEWIHNLDWIGQMSNTSVFGYEIAKIGQLTMWARQEYSLTQTAIWGISLGGQYSMLTAARFPELFDVVVISGATVDYEQNYTSAFDLVGVNQFDVLGANTQVALSAFIRRRDVATSILPKQIIFEMSTSDLSQGGIDFVGYVTAAANARGATPPEVVLFDGDHETNPPATLAKINAAFLHAGVPRQRAAAH